MARRELGDPCCQKAELTALIRYSGNMQVSAQRLALHVITSNPAIARRIFSLFKHTFHLNSELLVRRKIRLRKNNVYLIRIKERERVLEILQTLGLIKDGFLTQELNADVQAKKCCRRAYLRGAFLAAGSVTNPENSYHLEVFTAYRQQAEQLVDLMASFQVFAKITSLKNGWLVYIKDSEQIVEFLNVIGAHNALLNFENVRILKALRNQVNRLVNFETANMNKTVDASVRQLETIRVIEEKIGLSALDEPLREVARLRLAHPEASLQELGAMLEPPLTKSGVNHRLRRLEKIGKQLEKDS